MILPRHKLIARNIHSKDYCVIQFYDRNRKTIPVYNKYPIVLYLNAFLVEEPSIQYFWYITKDELSYLDTYLMDIPNNDWLEVYKSKL